METNKINQSSDNSQGKQEQEVKLRESIHMVEDNEEKSDKKIPKEKASDKALSQEGKNNNDNPLDFNSDAGSGKCKSVTKKMIKLPKYSKNGPQKQMTSTFGGSDFNKSRSQYSLQKAYGNKNKARLRYMKSMSPRKKFSKGKSHS